MRAAVNALLLLLVIVATGHASHTPATENGFMLMLYSGSSCSNDYFDKVKTIVCRDGDFGISNRYYQSIKVVYHKDKHGHVTWDVHAWPRRGCQGDEVVEVTGLPGSTCVTASNWRWNGNHIRGAILGIP